MSHMDLEAPFGKFFGIEICAPFTMGDFKVWSAWLIISIVTRISMMGGERRRALGKASGMPPFSCLCRWIYLLCMPKDMAS